MLFTLSKVVVSLDGQFGDVPLPDLAIVAGRLL